MAKTREDYKKEIARIVRGIYNHGNYDCLRTYRDKIGIGFGHGGSTNEISLVEGEKKIEAMLEDYVSWFEGSMRSRKSIRNQYWKMGFESGARKGFVRGMWVGLGFFIFLWVVHLL